MADGTVTRSSRGRRTIRLPISEDAYTHAVDDPAAFRRLLDEGFRAAPELFPPGFARGYGLKDDRTSAKRGTPIRRIRLRDGAAYSVRPSFLMPYMTARVADVEGPLFLRTFGVPFWALARVFGRDPMYWYRLTCGLGRSSIVGTTVRRARLPEHLLADEHHQTIDGEKADWLWGAFPFTSPFNVAATPAISLPAGTSEGLPIGVQLVTARGRDADLLNLAESLESALGFDYAPVRERWASRPVPEPVS